VWFFFAEVLLNQDRSYCKEAHCVVVDVREFFTKNLPLIERVIRFICRKNHLDSQEHEDFASVVMLRMIENDYSVIRKFEGRSSFGTFLTAVIQRFFLDYRIHSWGKWHTSNEAQRLGATAVWLERLLHRDGHSLEDALAVMLREKPELTRSELLTLAARLPPRQPRRRIVELSDAPPCSLTASEDAAEMALRGEQHRLSRAVSGIMRPAIDALPDDERLLLHLRFECDMSMAQIARTLQVHEKQIHRRVRRQLDALRRELERRGLATAEILAMIGENGSIFQFALSGGESRPSTSEKAVADVEELRR